MIEKEDTVIVIDAGPDFRQQMLRKMSGNWMPFCLLMNIEII